MNAVTGIKPVEIMLTPAEMRFVLAYRKMDDRRRGESMEMAESDAEMYPRRAAPSFRLIVGGAA